MEISETDGQAAVVGGAGGSSGQVIAWNGGSLVHLEHNITAALEIVELGEVLQEGCSIWLLDLLRGERELHLLKDS